MLEYRGCTRKFGALGRPQYVHDVEIPTRVPKVAGWPCMYCSCSVASEIISAMNFGMRYIQSEECHRLSKYK